MADKENWNRRSSILGEMKMGSHTKEEYEKVMSLVEKIEIFSSDDSIKSAFIRGFADSEGSVSKSKNRIALYSSNLVGLQDVLALLQELEINGKIYANKRAYVILISGLDNLQRFQEKINFTIKRKKERLERLLKYYSPLLFCPICGKKFSGSDALRRLKIHCSAKHLVLFEELKNKTVLKEYNTPMWVRPR